MGSAYTRKRASIGFPDRWDVRGERKRGLKNGSKMFGLSNQVAEETINQSRDDPKENRPGREGQKFRAGTSPQASG